ncbi:MAG: phage tail sheath family protein, partial [candidate division Zixibacteria bacterium]
MASNYTYPGVYVEEIPSGARTLVGVSTSNTAFVGFFKKGPTDKAVQVTSYGDFDRIFGGLDVRSEASYAIKQYYLNGGQIAWVIRVMDGGKKADRTFIKDDADALKVTAISKGKWGGFVQVSIDHAVREDLAATEDQEATAFNLVIREVENHDGVNIVIRHEVHRNLTVIAGDSRYAKDVVNGNSEMVVIELMGEELIPDARAADVIGDPHEGDFFPLIFGDRAIADAFIDFFDASVAASAAEATAIEAAEAAASVSAEAAAAAGAAPDDDDAAAAAVAAAEASATAADVATAASAAAVAALAATVAARDAFTAAERLASADADGVEPTVDGWATSSATLTGLEGSKTGIYRLENIAPEIFNLMCIPDAARLTVAGAGKAVYTDAVTYCEKKRAFLLVDIPSGTDTIDEVLSWRTNDAPSVTRNAAVYFPRLKVSDPLNENRMRNVAASGTLAGVYARTDATRGIWVSPAGTDAGLRGAEIAVPMTDLENGRINPRAINALRAFPTFGKISWGARTMKGDDQQADEYKYIPVRRLALYIEESLYQGLHWAVFSPNDAPLW